MISSVIEMRGVGKQIASFLARLNIYSIRDVLLHFPQRYQDRSRIIPIKLLKPGEEQLCQGTIISIDHPTRGRTKMMCELQDETGRLFLRFFNVMAFQKNIFLPGTILQCFGEVRITAFGREMVHPEINVVLDKLPEPLPHYTAIYPTTAGLYQKTWRQLAAQALTWLDKTCCIEEFLPQAWLDEHHFPDIKTALRDIHQPSTHHLIDTLNEKQSKIHQRIIFDELLTHRLQLLNFKNTAKQHVSPALLMQGNLKEKLLDSLPFSLTAAQQRVVKEIEQDLAQTSPMLRLLQGDVGSGKTIVAAFAALRAVTGQFQAAMMAPTELLAEQHYRVLRSWFEPLGIHVVFLSGQTKGSARKATLELMTSGGAQVVVGTHALFQEAVLFKNLALIIIDEQHRFGVEQRAQLREKGIAHGLYPHQLIMTATPIPRTLAMSLYADLDCSVLDELPPGRTPIVTSVMPEYKRKEVIDRIREACQKARQVYWVCPLIEESEVIPGEAATQAALQLQSLMPGIQVGLIHGQMPASEKEAVMQQFQRHEIHLLVATTVIEVGVDVPNASVMVIENAERLGLSQLHQLRGRVGRGELASHCILLYRAPLSEYAKARLTVMRETTDGFKIAEEDLALRGPGELLGTKQTGEISFRLADIIRDKQLLPLVHQTALELMNNRPEDVQKMLVKNKDARLSYGEI
ncbi:MAG: ATP-dependent DNA helicase RecG [Gammaproteobacteria bacterium]|nr:ATP-dependent DNA helicase RecG [Gammaproteobacteria bacterium]